MEQALQEIPSFRRSYPQFTGEDLRVWLTSRKTPLHPASQHAWGALTRTLLTAGTIRDTGRWRKMQAPRSHARRTPVWEFV